jgi:hypothetical protein
LKIEKIFCALKINPAKWGFAGVISFLRGFESPCTIMLKNTCLWLELQMVTIKEVYNRMEIMKKSVSATIGEEPPNPKPTPNPQPNPIPNPI